MSKLWEKANTKVEDIIVSFTVGQDYILDKELLKYDCLGSLAHIKMLRKVGLLKDKDFVALKNGLKEIYRQSLNNSFEINLEDEDCHTAIENFLIVKNNYEGYEDWYSLALLNLGEAYEKTNNNDAARDIYNTLQILRPDDDFGKTAKSRLRRMKR